MTELSDVQRAKLAAMIGLHQATARWQKIRVDTLVWAAALVDNGDLSTKQAYTALGVSRTTFYEHMRALRPVPGSEVEHEAALTVDTVLRQFGVTEDTTLDQVKTMVAETPDLEMALASVGVWKSREEATP